MVAGRDAWLSSLLAKPSLQQLLQDTVITLSITSPGWDGKAGMWRLGCRGGECHTELREKPRGDTSCLRGRVGAPDFLRLLRWADEVSWLVEFDKVFPVTDFRSNAVVCQAACLLLCTCQVVKCHLSLIYCTDDLIVSENIQVQLINLYLCLTISLQHIIISCPLASNHFLAGDDT